eukprot:3285586-Rhodomonas_salina.1
MGTLLINRDDRGTTGLTVTTPTSRWPSGPVQDVLISAPCTTHVHARVHALYARSCSLGSGDH